MKTANEIVTTMMSKDEFSKWLGIEIIESKAGSCQLRMGVRPEMCNGFGIAHGGITFSIADSALAFASNSLGRHSLSIETSISHIQKVEIGDVLIAKAEQESVTNRIGIFRVAITNQNEQLIALFKGTVYRMNTNWD